MIVNNAYHDCVTSSLKCFDLIVLCFFSVMKASHEGLLEKIYDKCDESTETLLLLSIFGAAVA